MSGKKLTDVGNRILIPKKAAMKLAENNRAYFRCQFDSNIQEGYNIMSLDNINHPDLGRPFNEQEKQTLLRALCGFIDKAITLPITEVEKQYGRPYDDKMDFTKDIDGDGEKVQIKHYAIGKGKLSKITRIHGFFNSQDVFVISRIDWNHRFHQKQTKT